MAELPPHLLGSPESSIHKSWIAGPMRASSKSTKCGPSEVHNTLPAWQSPCRRSCATAPARGKRLRHPSSAWSATPAQTASSSARHHLIASSQSRGSDAEAVDVQRFALRKTGARADHGGCAPSGAPSIPGLGSVEFRRATALARKQRETEPAVGEQGLAADHQRRHHRQFLGRHGGGEGVLLGDLRIAPAPGPVELGDQRRPSSMPICQTRFS
jgi:hypothetical protein